MKILIDLNKSVEENAGIYFDKAKKSKKKIEGAIEALNKSIKKLEQLKKKEAKKKAKEIVLEKRKKEWYEKFRWFYTSEKMLVIGGRDATTNEIVIKKHTDKEDIVFHTEMAGSPFFVIKTEGKKVSEKALDEVAEATASFSRAWKLGISSADVFWVTPEQVSKEAEAGEYMAKGAFMIRGKKNIMHAKLEIGIGIKDNVILSGPLSAIRKNSEKNIKIIQGRDKSSDIAKKVKKLFSYPDNDEIIRMLPAGGMKIVR